MNERNENIRRRGWRLLAAAAILIAGIIIGSTLPFLRSEREVGPPPKLPAPVPQKTRPPARSVPLLPLDRSQLLAAFAAAVDATASGKPLPAANSSLVGRTFVLRLPFGCQGPLADLTSQWAGWVHDPKTRALKLQAQPEVWDDAPWIKAIAGETPFEAVEGFWIRRPWTSAETCPPTNSEGPEEQTGSAPERRTIGIAQFFAPGSRRTMRRGLRPYAVTLRTDEQVATRPHEYHLLISGRITGFADGQPVHCSNEANDRRPICLIAAEFIRVAFEDAEDGSILSEWRN